MLYCLVNQQTNWRHWIDCCVIFAALPQMFIRPINAECLSYWGLNKWSIICRRYFQIHFLERKSSFIYVNSSEVYSEGCNGVNNRWLIWFYGANRTVHWPIYAPSGFNVLKLTCRGSDQYVFTCFYQREVPNWNNIDKRFHLSKTIHFKSAHR